ncbi:MAG: preprotein translocase subunit SecE [Candidatus Blackburnbacteria bacterium RIFCSPHIGHO2_02_FULL_39_13]|uniref:Protein translocase subunit SecE n=1 Tax=Candidatus Blackburnbacteria bacterium RIFCSPLOWO2_01_FULL_40_20 TaxID=1797519 RepID=A0A1G1VBD5_9BACT|nr:MAG: preprotein translocase subunit SecE [Candidatus Blackburnbacteria bacterium RIFCSPHIGHO2_01_FULL_40_17]OGY08921.1 MAG: preprotein translocase subunit SecE [Candidatus Blackburnbacteria bacterium RIFCSPHIGHO2_02_FULL_39_13]OGY12733.1 MAG: preprotein translocase subunit SecE [Candidatus Blackburnbacteria bacterium RIFCSPLOWO2_01_FULL_40_20]OGY15286.1 MAG: preprotein translocase subunit SecE [Candidatus Blackburnbacteria bacterium RIFCSPLOWO2_02_FULL_40_10]HBL51645.1 preprotein translocase
MNPVSFLLEVKSEMAKIVWPRRQQAIQLTLLVIVVSVVVGVYIGGLDFIFTNILNKILNR